MMTKTESNIRAIALDDAVLAALAGSPFGCTRGDLDALIALARVPASTSLMAAVINPGVAGDYDSDDDREYAAQAAALRMALSVREAVARVDANQERVRDLGRDLAAAQVALRYACEMVWQC